jgi:uncharacterized protein with von Willebrand factor type A (vWA) domain
LPTTSWDQDYGTNFHHALMLARQQLARQSGTKQIIMITDGEPTSHITPEGYPWFTYFEGWEAQQLTQEYATKEVMRCTREGIKINFFALDAHGGLRQFIEQMTQINHGRAFFTDAYNLGDYLLVDFLENRRRTARVR